MGTISNPEFITKGFEALGTAQQAIENRKRLIAEYKKRPDYRLIIENLSKEAFDYCREQLYPICEYQVLKKEDVRKMDLEEWLLRFQRSQDSAIIAVRRDDYCYWLNLLLNTTIACKKDSRADKYFHRAITMIGTAEESHSTEDVINDLGDATLIFLALFREAVGHFEDKKKYLITDISLQLTRDDMHNVSLLWNQKDFGPEELSARNMTPVALRKSISMKQKKIPNKDKTIARKNLFIGLVLFLGRNLDIQGVFGQKEGDDFDEQCK